MNPSVIDGLMRRSDIDGVLVGGASLDAATFGQIADMDYASLMRFLATPDSSSPSS